MTTTRRSTFDVLRDPVLHRAGHRGLAFWTGLLALALPLAACGGGGAGGGGGPTLQPPQDLAFPSASYVVRTDEPVPAIAPTWSGGDPTSWSVVPDPPAGITLNPSTGELQGMPQVAVPSTVYTVTATNSAGSDATNITVEVLWHEEKSIRAKTVFTDDDIRHLLERTHFGFSDVHYGLIQSMGVPAYVQAMTQLPPQTQLETDARNAYLVDEDDPNGMFPSHQNMVDWWTYMQVLNANPFQEVLALHWHDHFATGSTVLEGSNQYYMVNHVNLLRQQGAGNLRTFLTALARDWNMLEWLDGARNNGAPGQQPNENHAREWFELFCLGVDNGYTQQDIVEAARAFTGWRSRYNSDTGQSYMEFSPARHDANAKTVLGVVIPGQNTTDDYEAMTNLTLALTDPVSGRSRCARWIVRSTLRRFCYEAPAEELINQLAAVLENANWELKPMLDALFTSEAFYCARAKEGFIKTPIEHFVGFQRATQLFGDPNQVTRRAVLLGNTATQPPTVDGWPEGAAWMSAQGMVERANVIKYLIRDAKPVQDALGIDVADLLPPGLPTSLEVVDTLALRLRLSLTTAERDTFALYLDTDRQSNGTIISSPFSATNPTHINQRVRGLLYMMALHPTYLTR
jgi:uncharacterized protein (DUF1800 family)